MKGKSKRLRRLLLIPGGLAALLLIAAAAVALMYHINVPALLKKEQSAAPQSPDYNVVYKSVDGRDLHLDIYYPARRIFTKSPVVFYFHGGSWNSGSKNLDGDDIVQAVAQYGLMVVSVEYRLTDEQTFYPAFLDDTADAIRFMTKHAKDYGADPGRIGVFGASAGGQISLMMALAGDGYGSDAALRGTPVRIKSCVAICAPTDFLNLDVYENESDRAQVEALLKATFGGAPEELPEAYRDASPVNHLRKNAPPIFLTHGDKDPIVPIGQAEAFYQAAMKKGMDVRYHPVKNANHKFKAPDGEQTDPPVDDILKKLGEFLLKELIL